MLAALGPASESAAAGQKVLNRGCKVLQRGADVLREALQAVVLPHYRLQANGISQPSPKAATKFSSKPETNCCKNSETFVRGESPVQEDLNKYKPLDPSRCGTATVRPSRTNDNIDAAGEGEAPLSDRKRLFKEQRKFSCDFWSIWL